MAEVDDPARPRPRVLRHAQAGEQRRRLQLGTPYPHRGPAPACQQRQRTYQPPKPGDQLERGRLRVLNIAAERDRAPAERR